MKNNVNKNKAFKNTIKKMLPVVSVTIIGTILGLVSLITSKVPMIKNFGIMLAIGLVLAILVVLFIFMPILYIKDKHFDIEKEELKAQKVKKEKPNNKFVDKFLDIVFKLKYIILVIGVALAVLGIIVDVNAEAETNIENFMPQDNEALLDIRELRDEIGSTEQVAIVLSSDNVFNENNINLLKTITNEILIDYSDNIIESESLVTLYNKLGYVETEFINEDNLDLIPKDQRKLFINLDNSVTVINLSITEMTDEDFIIFVEDLGSSLDDLESDMTIKITGQSVINAEMMKSLTTGRYQVTVIGLILIFVTLLIIYRSFYRAILPIIPIVLIIGWSGGIMALFGLSYNPLTATLGSLIMGIGTDYTILIVERYREEFAKTGNRMLSIKTSVNKMGKPILVSALTTMGGFSALIFSDFVILSNFGIMTVVSFSLALLSSVIVLPAILSISFKNKQKA